MNIILQHWTGEMDELGLLSSANIKRYAERIGAEYRLLRGNVFNPNLTPPCQKIYMLAAEFDGYENMLMVDMDMFAVKDLAENVFEVPGTGLFSSYTQRIFNRCLEQHPKHTDKRFAYWGGAIYKMGLELRRKLRAHLPGADIGRFSHSFHDEGIIHHLAMKAGITQDRMPDRWCQCSYLPNPENAAMIHVRTKVTPKGPNRSKMENYRALHELLG